MHVTFSPVRSELTCWLLLRHSISFTSSILTPAIRLISLIFSISFPPGLGSFKLIHSEYSMQLSTGFGSVVGSLISSGLTVVVTVGLHSGVSFSFAILT